MRLVTPNRLQDLQRQLYCKSKAEPDYRFYTLWDKVYRRDVLEEAWRRVKANKGAGGVDGKTIAAIKEAGVDAFLSALQADLKAKTYRPLPVRRVGNSNAAFHKIRDYIVQKVMRYIRRKQLKRGFGWTTWTSDVLYRQYGLFCDYQILREPRGVAC